MIRFLIKLSLDVVIINNHIDRNFIRLFRYTIRTNINQQLKRDQSRRQQLKRDRMVNQGQLQPMKRQQQQILSLHCHQRLITQVKERIRGIQRRGLM